MNCLPGCAHLDPGQTGFSRRSMLGVVGAVGATGLLAACGGGGSTTTTGGGGSAADDPAGGGSSSAGSAGDALVKTSKVPVGNGVILSDKEVVVVQPTAGDFKAFSAVCTHEHCIVGMVKDGVISCPCHGSAYSAKDGSVLQGPATQALHPIKVSVQGDEVVTA
jgi:Rieske Fe-S protein